MTVGAAFAYRTLHQASGPPPPPPAQRGSVHREFVNNAEKMTVGAAFAQRTLHQASGPPLPAQRGVAHQTVVVLSVSGDTAGKCGPCSKLRVYLIRHVAHCLQHSCKPKAALHSTKWPSAPSVHLNENCIPQAALCPQHSCKPKAALHSTNWPSAPSVHLNDKLHCHPHC